MQTPRGQIMTKGRQRTHHWRVAAWRGETNKKLSGAARARGLKLFFFFFFAFPKISTLFCFLFFFFPFIDFFVISFFFLFHSQPSLIHLYLFIQIFLSIPFVYFFFIPSLNTNPVKQAPTPPPSVSAITMSSP